MPRPPFYPHDIVGPYTIEGIFDIGGMGVVYTVTEGDILVKAPFADANHATLERFRREVRMLLSLKHPGVIQVLEEGETEEGIPWYSMPLLSGPSLSERFEKPASVFEALKTTARIAQAMAYVHEKGITHRDLKPDNILFVGDRPVILDFGLARIAKSTRFTLGPIGTPFYMAPEQLDPARPIDERADVYAMGALLYKMLVGWAPFDDPIGEEKKEDEAMDEEELKQFYTMLSDPTQSPTDPQLINPDIDDEVKRICLKALAFKPEDRYKNAGEMAKDLNSWLREELVKQGNLTLDVEKSAEAFREAIEYGQSVDLLQDLWKMWMGRAVKIIIPEESQKELGKRALNINCPYILNLLDIKEGPYPYWIMLAPTGESLSERLDQGRILSPTIALKMVRQLTEALEAGKTAGLALSIDPGEIYIGKKDFKLSGVEKAKLIDGGKEDLYEARDLGILVSQALTGVWKTRWKDLPDFFQKVLRKAIEGGEARHARELASSLEEAWRKFVEKTRAIDDLKKKLSIKGDEAKEAAKKLAAIIWGRSRDFRGSIRQLAREALEQFSGGKKDERGWKSWLEERGISDVDPLQVILTMEEGVSDEWVRPFLPSGFQWSGDIAICQKDGSEMIYIPSGVFMMGSEDEDMTDCEKPVHEVHLAAYLIDKYPVTWKQYLEFCRETGHKPPPAPHWGIQENHPVVNINWFDAKAYSEWANKSMPTEAQWEKAARGGIWLDGDRIAEYKNPNPNRRYPWGDESPEADDYANHSETPEFGNWSTSPVGYFPKGASPYGCMDMTGNVLEWCEDWFDGNYYMKSPKINPEGPKSGYLKVLRGGSRCYQGRELYLSCRLRGLPITGFDFRGFRTVRNLT